MRPIGLSMRRSAAGGVVVMDPSVDGAPDQGWRESDMAWNPPRSMPGKDDP